MVKESEVLERIGQAIDEADLPQLAQLHNDITKYPPIKSDEIVAQEGWHLIPKEGVH